MQHERHLPRSLGFSLQKTIAGLTLSVATASQTGISLLPLKISATVPISDDQLQNFSLGCTFANGVSFSGELISKFANIQSLIGPSFGWMLSSGFPFNAYILGGCALSQEKSGTPMISEIAAVGDYRVLQGSVAYKHGLGIPLHGLLLGVNFWLDRGLGLNFSYDLQLARSEGNWKSGSNAALGLEMTRNRTTVRLAIATNATVHSSISHKILENMNLTVRTELTMFPLTCTIGARLEVESHGY
jgi:hypothetical protein